MESKKPTFTPYKLGILTEVDLHRHPRHIGLEEITDPRERRIETYERRLEDKAIDKALKQGRYRRTT